MSINLGQLSTKEAITAIYVGYFDRAPDPTGLDYWIGRADAGMPLSAIAESFSEQVESTTEYPYFVTPSVASAQAFLTQVYVNLFNRAPDGPGLAYWTNELTSGNTPVGEIILNIISGATDSAAGNDMTTVLNKIEVGCDWAVDAANAGINANPFTNDPEAVAGAKAALDGVDDTAASVTAALAETDAFIAGYGNDDPITTPGTATANEDAVLNGFVQATDPDGDTLSYSVAPSNTTSNGTLVMNADGSYVYTPNADFVGSDSFTFTVTDGNGGSATGTVAITVNNTNDAPIASNVIATTAEDNAVTVTPVSSDIDLGDTATYTVGSNPSNGSVVANANGTFTYTPNADFFGTDAFDYIVTDAAGATSIATATVTVTAVDDAPVAANSSAGASEGAAVVTGSVSATDIDSASIGFALNGAAPAGLTFNNDGSFSFDPANPAYDSLDAGDVLVLTVPFTATASGQSDGGVLTITVTGTNDAPVASAVTATGAEDGGAITVTPASSDVDADDTATYSISANPSNGAVVVNGASFSYTPNANFNGTDTFQYTVTDSQGATSTATATVTVTSVNDAPVVADDAVTGFEDQAITGQLTGTDVDGDTLTFALTDDVDNGSLVFNSDGSYTYTPNTDFNGSDSFTVSVSDGNGGTDTATVNISVTAVDDVLTTGIDDISGGAADDVFLANGQTLNPGDSIDGGDGTDTLFVATTGRTVLTAFLTSNLENITLTHDGDSSVINATNPSHLLSVDLSSTVGVQNVTVENSFNDADLRFMEGNNVALNNLTNSVDVLIDGRNTNLTGGSDALNIDITGSQTTGLDTGSIDVDAAYETVNITTQGTNGPVAVTDLNTDVNTDAGSTYTVPGTRDVLPTTASGAHTLNIGATGASLTIGDTDMSTSWNTTNGITGIENPLNAGLTTVDASGSTQQVTFSVQNDGASSATNLDGGSASDRIEGGDNNDTIDGNGGSDTLDGEGGNDVINGGAGNDVLLGLEGNDTMDGGADHDNLYGGAGNDSQTGGTGNDYIDTGFFADGAGTEFVDAGDGSDTVQTRGEFLVGRSAATGNDLTPNPAGSTTNVDVLGGGEGTDTLRITGSTADTRGLNDVTGFENIQLNSGTFNLVIDNFNATESAFEADHDGRVAGGGSTTIDGTNANGTVLVNASTLDQAITLIGGDLSDTLTGGAGNDTIRGDGDSNSNNGGQDNLFGGLGNDTFITTADQMDVTDVIEGDGGNDTVVITTAGGRTSGVAASNGNNATFGAGVGGIETIQVEDLSDTTFEGDLTVEFLGFNNNDGADSPRVHVDGSGLDANASFPVLTEDLTVLMNANGFDEDIQVTGGAGDDTINMGQYLDSGDQLDGGAGTDTVVIETAHGSIDNDFANVSNIECIVLTDTGAGTITLGANAQAAFTAGVTPKIDASNVASNITINAAAFTVPVMIIDGSGNNTLIGGSAADIFVMNSGDDSVDGNGGDDVIQVSGSELDGNDSINGDAGNDTIRLMNGEGPVTAVSNLDNNATVENYVLDDDGDRIANTNVGDVDNNQLTFTNGNVNTLTTINVDASALTDDVDTFRVTLDASQTDADFAFNVTGSEEDDTFEKRNDGVDNNVDFMGGAGNDNFILNASDAGSTTAYNGGDGTDTLTLSGGQIVDDGFVSMEDLEVLDSEAGVALNARLGVEADRAANDAQAFTLQGSALGDDVVVDAAFDDDLIINMNGGDDNFDVSASSGTVTFNDAAGNVDANDTLQGGTGAGDVMNLTADNGTADLSTTSNVETFNVVESGDNNIGMTITDATFTGVADGEIDVDASALNDTGLALPEGALTLNAGGVTSGELDVVGGTGDDNITTGGGDDTVSSGDGNDTISTGAGTDTVLAGAGNDAVSTGAGADVIDGGTGNDSIDGGAANDTIDGGTGNDLITGGAGLDELTGGDGADQFRYVTVADSNALTRDTICDFDTSEGDEIVIETALIFAAVNAANTPVPQGIPQNIGLATPNSQNGFNFAGNATSFSDAQGAISLTGKDGVADFVLEDSGLFGPNVSKLWIDVNDDGVLNGLDIQILLKDVTIAGNGGLAGDELRMIDLLPPTLSPIAIGIQEVRLSSATTTTGDALAGNMDGSDNDGTPVTYSIAGSPAVAGTITVVGTYGTLVLNEATGAYTYTPNAAAIEALDDTETASDVFNVTVTDDVALTTTSTFTVDVTGADDQPVLGAVTAGSVTEVHDSATQVNANLTGNLSTLATDVDIETLSYGITGGTPVPATTTVQSVGIYGTLTVDTVTGVYTYVPNTAAIEAVAEGETPTDTFAVTVDDGDDGAVAQNFVVTINGANDAPVVSLQGTDDATGAVVETNATNLIDNGTLTVNDVDLSNTVSVSVGAPVVAGMGGAIAGEAAMLQITSGPNHTANVGETNNVGWQFNSGTETYNALAAGETRTLTYTLTFTDNSATPLTDTQTVTVTITGSNDVPSIDVVGGAGDSNSGILTELPGSADLGPVSDTVTVTDVDITDELALTVSTARSTMVDSGAQNGVTTVITPGLQADIDAAVFSVAPNPAVVGATTTEQVTWTFTPAVGSTFDELQAGDTLTLEYDITVDDSNGGTDLETISVVIIGTNDLPSITGATNPAAPYAEGAGDNSAQDLPAATGTITVSDLDVGDALTFSVTGAGTASLNAGGSPTEAGPFPGGASATNADSVAASIAALTAAGAVTFDNDTSNGGSTTSNWTYDPAATDLDWLRAGDTLTVTFVAQVNDGLSGNVGAQNLVITITGTNDVPVIDGATNPAAILEIAGDSSAQDIAPTTGTITVTDQDLGDTLTYSVTGNAVASLNGGGSPTEAGPFPGANSAGNVDSVAASVAALTASGAVSFAPTTTNGEDVITTWTYDPAATDLDWLRAGDTLTLTYVAQVDDGAGNVGAQNLVVTITGTNDVPTIDAATNPAAILEVVGDSSAQDIPATTGTITITDQDLGDTLVVTVTGNATATYAGGAVPVEDSVDISALIASGAITFAPATSNGEDVTLTWTYDPAAADLDWLQDGQDLVLTFVAQVNDGAGNVGAQNLVITITGTNDVPTIDSATNPAAILEVAGDSSAQDIAPTTGTITVTDQDLGDTLTFSVTGDATASYNGGAVPVEDSVDVSALIASGAISFANDTSNGEATTSNWTYDPAAADLDWLRDGDSLTLTYTAQVTDGAGNVGAQPLVITITGTNDVPVIDGATNPAAILEIAGDSSAQDIAPTTGTITVTDQDLGDTLTFSVTGDAVATHSGAGVPGSADVSALIASGAISFANDTSNGEATTSNWTYDPAAADLDWLRDGETLTLTYTAQVTDGAGNVGAQPLVITITGTNDVPVINAVTDPAGVTELANASAQVIAGLTGTVTVTDLDVGDTLTVSTPAAATAVWSGGAAPAGAAASIATLTAAGNFTIPGGTQPSNGSTPVAFTYDYTAAAADLDWLADGETLTVSYQVQVNDGAGNVVSTETVDIVITGTNDAPALALNAAGVTATEISLLASDADFSDTIALQTGINGSSALNNDGTTTEFTVNAQAVAVSTDLVVVDAPSGVTTDSMSTLIQGTIGNDTLNPVLGGRDGIYYGFDGDDDITGGAAADIIFGGADNDTIDGAGGDDAIDAGAGDDTVVYDAADATVDGVDGGADTDTIDASAAGAGVTIDLNGGTDAYINFENIIGSANDDTLTGNASANVIVTGAGADSVALGNDGVVDRIEYSVTGNVVDDAPAAGANTGFDTITGVDTTFDLIVFDGLTLGGGRSFSLANTAVGATGSNSAIGAADAVLFVNNSAINVASGTLATDIASTLEGAFNMSTLGAGEAIVFSLETTVAGTQVFGIYTEQDGADTGAAAGDIQIVGVGDGAGMDGDNFSL